MKKVRVIGCWIISGPHSENDAKRYGVEIGGYSRRYHGEPVDNVDLEYPTLEEAIEDCRLSSDPWAE